MTTPLGEAASCCLRIWREHRHHTLEPTQISCGGYAPALIEDCSYQIVIGSIDSGNRFDTATLFIDDVLINKPPSGPYGWTPFFFAGRVTAVVVERSGAEHVFCLDVSPTPDKVDLVQFEGMLQAIKAFDAAMLLGDSSGAMAFGRGRQSSAFEWLLQLARLRQHGPGFLASVQQLARQPHRMLQASAAPVPLSHIKRLHSSTLREQRFARLAVGDWEDDGTLDTIRLLSQSPVWTVDTPANRAMMALLMRFIAAARRLLMNVRTPALRSDPQELRLRQLRREQWLDNTIQAATLCLQSSPFNTLTRIETSSVALTHIAAHPAYSRSYRQGAQALHVGIDGNAADDVLPVSPSWGIYEAWCFVHICTIIRRLATHAPPKQPTRMATADRKLCVTLDDGRELQVMFQATFRAGQPRQGYLAWSLSMQRIPDIVLSVREGDHWRFLVLDAKYRSGKRNTLDAMSSAHLYHDALRLKDVAPDLCLLLMPGPASVAPLAQDEFWQQHRVGTLCDFTPGGKGLERCKRLLKDWLDCKTPHSHPALHPHHS